MGVGVEAVVVEAAVGLLEALTVSAAPVAYTAELGDVQAEDGYTGTVAQTGAEGKASVASAEPVDCRRAGLACRRSCPVVEGLVRDMAVEVRGWSLGGGCELVSSVATCCVPAAAKDLDGHQGSH